MARSAHGISDSEFAMWRSVFAFALVDNVLSMEEQGLLKTYYTNIPFSPLQSAILNEDFKFPQDVATLFRGITETKDKERFCVLARALVWCEGDMDEQERRILKHVGCLADADSEMLKGTRTHPALQSYHQHYAKAGMMGLMKAPFQTQIRV